jgi:hypothetical protein
MLFELSLSMAGVLQTKIFFLVCNVLSDTTTEPTFQKWGSVLLTVYTPSFLWKLATIVATIVNKNFMLSAPNSGDNGSNILSLLKEEFDPEALKQFFSKQPLARRGLVVTRRKQSNRKRIVLSSNESGWKDSNNLIDGSKGETATVSVADCLACSGCITAAESVMVGKHSLPTLRENFLGQYGTYHISSHNQELLKRDRKIIFTISPAVVADLTRFIYLDREDSILSDRSTIDNNTREMIREMAV